VKASIPTKLLTPKTWDGGFSTKAKNIAVGIDQSYSGFGLTLLDTDCGNWHTEVFKAPGSHVDRLYWISEYLKKVFNGLASHADNIDVGMEGYAYGSIMANMAGELGAVVKLACYTSLDQFHGKYPYIIPPTMIKKYVTGKGTGVQKNQILLNVYKKWGVEFTDDNAADAYAIAHLVGGRRSLVYEIEMFEKIQDPKFREQP
jgi:Holliday junction resolvasome RuvABC endonuclease subunit